MPEVSAVCSRAPAGRSLGHRPASPAPTEIATVHFDYTTVGHVSVDVMPGGARRAGGSAFYSALQAARLGRQSLIITQGVEAEIHSVLAPFRSELELQILPASETTTLQSTGDRAPRAQRLLAWAGRMEEGIEIDSSIVHLAPIARETPTRWSGRADFIGLTPQGLVRAWAGAHREIHLVALAPALLPERWDAAVISETERESATGLLPATASRRAPATASRRAVSRGPAAADGDAGPTAPGDGAATAVRSRGLVAVTAAAAPTSIHMPDGEVARVRVPVIEDFCDDVGAGDVFAAAFFVALHEGRPARAAAAFANAAAAVRIAGAGAGAIGDRTAVEARLGGIASA
jgi:sugar/nucleoside kinase (ribokinase family)